MNMFARFDEIPPMTLQDIKERKRYGMTDAMTDSIKTVYPPQTKYVGGEGKWGYNQGNAKLTTKTAKNEKKYC